MVPANAIAGSVPNGGSRKRLPVQFFLAVRGQEKHVHTALNPLPSRVFVDQLAQAIGLNKFTLYHWIRESPERLPPVYRQGSRVCFKLEDVQAWMDDQLQPYEPRLARLKEGRTDPPLPAETKRKGTGRPTKSAEIKKRMEGS